MKQIIKIDKLDAKILEALVKNSRVKLKDLAEENNVSSNAIFNRIKRLKENGLIRRATLFTNMPALGYEIAATIGISLRPSQEAEVLRLVRDKRINEAAISRSMGKYDLCLFMMTRDLAEMQNFKKSLMLLGIERVSVNLWVKPSFYFENVNFNSTE